MTEVLLVLAGDDGENGDLEVRSIDPRFDDLRGIRSRDGAAKDGPNGLRPDALIGVEGGPIRVAGTAGKLAAEGLSGLTARDELAGLGLDCIEVRGGGARSVALAAAGLGIAAYRYI